MGYSPWGREESDMRHMYPFKGPSSKYSHDLKSWRSRLQHMNVVRDTGQLIELLLPHPQDPVIVK